MTSDADAAAVAALEAAVKHHLADVCRRIGLSTGGSIAELKRRIVFRREAPGSAGSPLGEHMLTEVFYRAGLRGRLKSGHLGERIARWACWVVLRDSGMSWCAITRLSMLGRTYDHTSVMSAVRRFPEVAKGPDGHSYREAVRHASDVFREWRVDNDDEPDGRERLVEMPQSGEKESET